MRFMSCKLVETNRCMLMDIIMLRHGEYVVSDL